VRHHPTLSLSGSSLQFRRDTPVISDMAATSSFQSPPQILLPKTPLTSYSSQHSIENFLPAKRRSRCISCSDSGVGSSFEDSSFLLENTLLPRRSRTSSISDRIKSSAQKGTVSYFCRSRGHGYILGQENGEEHFVHVSDIESEFVPMKEDKVSFRLCPIPPKFERCQAVNVQITEMSSSPHRRWDSPQTAEDLETEELQSRPPPADV